MSELVLSRDGPVLVQSVCVAYCIHELPKLGGLSAKECTVSGFVQQPVLLLLHRVTTELVQVG